MDVNKLFVTTAKGGFVKIDKGGFGLSAALLRTKVNVPLASPSVTMNFHDASKHHPAKVVQPYPNDLGSPGKNQGRNENEDQNGQNGGS